MFAYAFQRLIRNGFMSLMQWIVLLHCSTVNKVMAITIAAVADHVKAVNSLKMMTERQNVRVKVKEN